MFMIVLYQPEIPPNTGNIIRLCANTGFQLHLIEPLGFTLEDKSLRRAGLDYREWAKLQTHTSWEAYLSTQKPSRILALTTKGSQNYAGIAYQAGDTLLFGSETRGLPREILESLPENQRLRLPMLAHSRSLNLSNTVGIVCYEAWRQQGFAGGK